MNNAGGGSTRGTGFLAGDGQLAAMIRAYDWSASGLGPIEAWPQSLKTAVDIVLHSPVPLVMLWGPDGIMIYNDAYAVFAGGRHPRLLGSKVLEGWPEVADFNRRVMEVGLAGGTLSFRDQRLVLHRNDVPEDVWMNLDYSPIRDEAGRPAGVLAVVVETTERMQAERALRESQERFAAALEAAQLGAFDWNVRTGEALLDDRARELFGLPRTGPLRDDEVFARIHPDDFARVRAAADRSFREGARLEIDYSLRPDRGVERTILSISNVVPGADGEPERLLGVFADITERKQVETALKEERDRLYGLFEEAPGLVVVVHGPDHVFQLANKAYRQLVGDRDLIGKTVREALPELVEQGFLDLVDRVYRTGEPYVGVAVPGRLQRAPGEEPEERFFDFVYQPIREADGSVSGIFHQGYDVTERVVFLAQQKLLLDELNHRVKNNLATVQAIAHQTARNAPDLKTFRKTFESRLIALSRTHDVLTAGSWESADLQALLQSELGMYGENRVRLEGPPVRLSPRHTLSRGLVIHELATNAAKYGPLSLQEDGCVRVSWSVDGEDGAQQLDLLWRENDGPQVAQPERVGFGSELIRRGVRELGGEVSKDWRAEGLICRIRVPL